MEEKELNEQLQAATQFIIDSKEESVNYRSAGQRFKEGAETYRSINDKTIEEVSQALQKRPEALVSQEQLNQIEQTAERGARKGVTTSQCQMPNTEMLAETVSNLVMKKISSSIDDTIAKSMERHRTRIDVHHEHHHSQMYGCWASSERNCKMMAWLGFISLLCIAQMVVFICDWCEVISLDYKIFIISFGVTVFLAIVGFIKRLCSEDS